MRRSERGDEARRIVATVARTKQSFEEVADLELAALFLDAIDDLAEAVRDLKVEDQAEPEPAPIILCGAISQVDLEATCILLNSHPGDCRFAVPK